MIIISHNIRHSSAQLTPISHVSISLYFLQLSLTNCYLLYWVPEKSSEGPTCRYSRSLCRSELFAVFYIKTDEEDIFHIQPRDCTWTTMAFCAAGSMRDSHKVLHGLSSKQEQKEGLCVVTAFVGGCETLLLPPACYVTTSYFINIRLRFLGPTSEHGSEGTPSIYTEHVITSIVNS